MLNKLHKKYFQNPLDLPWRSGSAALPRNMFKQFKQHPTQATEVEAKDRDQSSKEATEGLLCRAPISPISRRVRQNTVTSLYPVRKRNATTLTCIKSIRIWFCKRATKHVHFTASLRRRRCHVTECVCGCSWIVFSSSIWTCTMCHWPSHRCVSDLYLWSWLIVASSIWHSLGGEPLGRHIRGTDSTAEGSSTRRKKLTTRTFETQMLTSWQVAFSMFQAFHGVTNSNLYHAISNISSLLVQQQQESVAVFFCFFVIFNIFSIIIILKRSEVLRYFNWIYCLGFNG